MARFLKVSHHLPLFPTRAASPLPRRSVEPGRGEMAEPTVLLGPCFASIWADLRIMLCMEYFSLWLTKRLLFGPTDVRKAFVSNQSGLPIVRPGLVCHRLLL
jgi:hypothetical protein